MVMLGFTTFDSCFFIRSSVIGFVKQRLEPRRLVLDIEHFVSTLSMHRIFGI